MANPLKAFISFFEIFIWACRLFYRTSPPARRRAFRSNFAPLSRTPISS